MKICFVGNDFHQNIRSSSFFVDLLRRIGSVTELHANPDGGPLGDDALIGQLMQGGFDRYIFWQTESIAERVIARDLGLSFLVPAFDSVGARTPPYWSRFVKHRFLSFSRAQHEALQRLGCLTDYFQYYPDPGPDPGRGLSGDPDAGLFREPQPSTSLDLRRVLAQCGELRIRRLHVHATADLTIDARPQQPTMIDGIEVSVSRSLDRRTAFDTTAGAALFYFAPREGIDTAMLDAMARGQIVVAASYPIAKDYVAHRATGLLYDPVKDTWPARPDDAQLLRISRAARRKAEEGRAAWLKDIDRLLSIVADDGRRWSTRDYSAHFVRRISRAAHGRLRDAR